MTLITAPVVMFAYMRADHLRQTLLALKANPEAASTELYVYCDAAKSAEHQAKVDEVRHLVEDIDGFAKVHRIYRDKNMGLANSIIKGVTQVLTLHERVIVLEDDLVTSPYFLSYMNAALNRFEHDEQVISIHGYVYPVEEVLPEAFFIPGADCWGWATWRRGWALFNSDGQALIKELKDRKLEKAFDFNGSYSYTKMLGNQVNGKNDSWAIRWYASAFLANKLTLYPGRSLVHNIGNDDTGTHCGATSTWDVLLSHKPINLSNLTIAISESGYIAFEKNFKQATSLKSRFLNKLKWLLRKLK
jgi:hypothetical protein